jgi:hypothetical protein
VIDEALFYRGGAEGLMWLEILPTFLNVRSAQRLFLVQKMAAGRSRGSGGFWSTLLCSLTGARSAVALNKLHE